MRRAIPQYFLYGEATQDVDERFLHVESIAERSRRHDWTIRPHAHRDLFHLLFVLKGGGVLHAEGSVHTFAANSLITVSRSCVHGFDFKPGTDGWIVTASGVLLTRITREHSELAPVFDETCIIPMKTPAVPGLAALFDALVAELSPNAAHPKNADSQLASRYRALVEEHYRSAWTIADYAKKLCISAERLRVACVRTTGSSPLALLNARRLLEAKRSLLYTNMSVALIAESCGFPDPAYFSRFFARSTGQSPRAYRLRRRAGGYED
jgi:AraC family transcriptional activator of pobA